MTPSSFLHTPTGRLRAWLSSEVVAGSLVIAAAAIGLIWANSPYRESFHWLESAVIGPQGLHLALPVGRWASDGLLAVFFFVVGLELKREFVAGSLRQARLAAVPVIAAVFGMAVPAAVYCVVLLLLGEPSALPGWAIPTATDIAFALAVLAIFGGGLPAGLRLFLLTLAVADDLLAIIVIAVFYTSTLQPLALLASLVTVALFAALAGLPRPRWWLLWPAAALTWGLMHASGVHATIAGVLLGLAVPALARHGEQTSRSQQFGRAIGPWSAGVALPVFALFAAGVTIIDGEGLAFVLGQPVVTAIVLALVVGKTAGVVGATALLTWTTPLRLPDGLALLDLLPIGPLCGIGFTVSLLIATLSFPDGAHTDGARVAVLLGTLTAATLAAVLLRWEARQLRRRDMKEDGIEDSPQDVS